MTETYLPSDAHNSGDVTDVEYEAFAADGYVIDGAVGVPSDSPILFADGSGRTAKIRADSIVMLRGGRWHTDAEITLDLDANTSGSIRYDLIVIRLDRDNEGGFAAAATVVKGVPGAGVPAATQTIGASGKYDHILGYVKVISGAASTGNSDVTYLSWYVGEPIYVCTSTTRPPHRYGRLIRDDDGWWWSDGATWRLVNQVDSGIVNLAPASGWSLSWGSVRKINGLVVMALNPIRTGGTLAPSTNNNVTTVPAGYRPDRTINVVAYLPGGSAALVRVNSAGTVFLEAFGATSIEKDDSVSVTQAVWWAA